MIGHFLLVDNGYSLIALIFLIYCGLKWIPVEFLPYSGLALTALFYGPVLYFEYRFFYSLGFMNNTDMAVGVISCFSGYLIGWLAKFIINCGLKNKGNAA
jgi:hypothetical protein